MTCRASLFTLFQCGVTTAQGHHAPFQSNTNFSVFLQPALLSCNNKTLQNWMTNVVLVDLKHLMLPTLPSYAYFWDSLVSLFSLKKDL